MKVGAVKERVNASFVIKYRSFRDLALKFVSLSDNAIDCLY